MVCRKLGNCFTFAAARGLHELQWQQAYKQHIREN